ncbi:TetR/AcrR family transcriptional regulator [Kitasatospora sp. NBC_01250]|uniref:TetR/AcrR family transcriptional regulator n=1 Tax=Kitasatospora sp. NBC_01250 TaxID=2903571 RepID=UPI002E2EB29F|nr:TetR/AcrR family transcriptional regulator [Kitasatospora sp. NBC_01250]
MKQTTARPGAGEPAAPPAATARRRGKALEQAIFEAALEQLTSGGYARLTMEGVAGAAQTGKAALYRRWPSKLELALDALGSTLPPLTDVPDLGSVRAELRQLIGTFQVAMDSPAGSAMRALMAEVDHGGGGLLKDFVMARLVGPARRAGLEVLRRGERRGEVRSGAVNEMVADVWPAMLLYRTKFGAESVDAEFCDHLLEDVLLPLIRPQAG